MILYSYFKEIIAAFPDLERNRANNECVRSNFYEETNFTCLVIGAWK